MTLPDQIWGYGEALLPRVLGALLLLVVGLFVVSVVVRLLVRVLTSRDVDALADRLGAGDVLGRAGFERSVVQAVALGVRLFLSVVVLFAALALLGLAPLQDALNRGVLFLPRLFAAAVLILIGLMLGALAQKQIERWTWKLGLRGPLDEIAQVAVVAVFVIMAVGVLGVPNELLIALAAILLGGMALTLSLAFGLGSRDLAREVSTGRFVAQNFSVGQTVTVAGVSGEIRVMEATATVLEDAAGRTVRVPNHLFLHSVVTVDGRPSERAP
jgi:small-conductance mechanosensitive channel